MTKITNDQALEIARLALPSIETLETRNSDRLDFHDISANGLKRLIEAAYAAGQASIPQGAITTLLHSDEHYQYSTKQVSGGFEVYRIGRDEKWADTLEGAQCLLVTADDEVEAIEIAKTAENACWG